jgi:hypothetical protein
MSLLFPGFCLIETRITDRGSQFTVHGSRFTRARQGYLNHQGVENCLAARDTRVRIPEGRLNSAVVFTFSEDIFVFVSLFFVAQ